MMYIRGCIIVKYRCYALKLIGLVCLLTENILYSVLFDKKNRSKHFTPHIVLFLCIFTKLLHDASYIQGTGWLNALDSWII
jgi:hypothetical protein